MNRQLQRLRLNLKAANGCTYRRTPKLAYAVGAFGSAVIRNVYRFSIKAEPLVLVMCGKTGFIRVHPRNPWLK